MLNPNLDIDALASEYSRDDRLRIENLLDPAFAERLHTACRDDVPYEFICHLDGNNVVIPEDEMRQMSQDEQNKLGKQMVDEASRGVGFFYSGYQMVRAQTDTDDPKLAFLHSMFDFVNSKELLSVIATITGQSELVGADAHYTRYAPGQYLTRHKDDIKREGRRIAYVMGFSKNWHPDWGGLLQFFEDDGTPRDFWIPTFNSLVLFDVRHVHSVSYVTPFAKEQRLSLTGWFCT